MYAPQLSRHARVLVGKNLGCHGCGEKFSAPVHCLLLLGKDYATPVVIYSNVQLSLAEIYVPLSLAWPVKIILRLGTTAPENLVCGWQLRSIFGLGF
jgi:hypothetical protein